VAIVPVSAGGASPLPVPGRPGVLMIQSADLRSLRPPKSTVRGLPAYPAIVAVIPAYNEGLVIGSVVLQADCRIPREEFR